MKRSLEQIHSPEDIRKMTPAELEGAVRVPAQDPGADGFQDRRTSLLQPRGGGADGRAA